MAEAVVEEDHPGPPLHRLPGPGHPVGAAHHGQATPTQELELVAVEVGPPGFGVDSQRPADELTGHLVRRVRDPQPGLDAGDQLGETEWLGDVVVGAGAEPDDDVHLLGTRHHLIVRYDLIHQTQLLGLSGGYDAFAHEEIQGLGQAHVLDQQMLAALIGQQGKAQGGAAHAGLFRCDPEITGQGQGETGLDGDAVNGGDGGFIYGANGADGAVQLL